MDTPQHVHTCHDVPDLLGLLPTLFGFVPYESVIAVAVDGPRSRFGFRLRMDLPDVCDIDDVTALASRHLRLKCPDAVILIVLSENSEVAAHVIRSFTAHIEPLPVKLAVTATSKHYWCWDDAIATTSGSWDSDAVSPAVTQAVWSGQQIMSSRADVQARYAPVAGLERNRMIHVTNEVVGAFEDALSGANASSQWDTGTGTQQIQPVIARGLAVCADLTRNDLAILSVWMGVPSVRDAVLRDITRHNADRQAELWTRVAQHVVPPYEAPVLTITGLCRWLCGDGAQALMALERALGADPNFVFGRTMMEALLQGMDPRVWDCF